MKPEFYVGQRVKCARISLGPGTIVRIEHSIIGVRFDSSNKAFHDLGGACENHHGLWVADFDLEPLEDMAPEYALGSAEVLYA